MIVQKQRASNIELFRIITMLAIVAHHYVMNSGLLHEVAINPTSSRSLFYLLFGAWGKTGINCFVLITGFFMCQSKLTLRKYLKLVLEVYFYRFTIFLIFFVLGKEAFSLSTFLQLILPFSTIKDNFTGCFLAFYLLIPFMNLAIGAMNKRKHSLLLGLLLLIYTVLATVPTVQVTFNYITWFIVLYFIGSYLCIYHISWLEKKTGRKLIAAIVISAASIVGLVFYAKWSGAELSSVYYLVSDANKPLALLVAALAFTFFQQLRINYNPWINKTAATTFGVLLIHANSAAMRSWLWGSLLHNRQMYISRWAVPHAVLSVIGVFAVCALIDRIRIVFLETPMFRIYDKYESTIVQAGKSIIKKAL